MDPEQPGMDKRRIFIMLGIAAAVAVVAYLYFKNKSGSSSASGSPSTSGGGGTASAGATTLQKGAITVNVTQGAEGAENDKNPQPKPPVTGRGRHHLTQAQRNELIRAGLPAPGYMSNAQYTKAFTSTGDPEPWLMNRSTSGNPGHKPGSNVGPKKTVKRPARKK